MRALVSPLAILFLLSALVQHVLTVPNLPSHRFVAQLYSGYGAFFSNPVSTRGDPADFDFWREASKLGDKLQRYVDKELASASKTYADVSDKISELQDTMTKVVNAATDMRNADTQSHWENRDVNIPQIDYAEFGNKLSEKVDEIITQFFEEFQEPPPGDESERERKTEDAIDWLLQKIEDALVEVYATFGVPEAEARRRFGYVKPHIKDAVLITAKIVEEHPVLVGAVIFAAVAYVVVPEGLILRPILRVFGWTPAGPGKGSVAAALQRFFYGGAIPKGSWFSWLQKAGMTVGRTSCKAVAGAGAVAILTGAF